MSDGGADGDRGEGDGAERRLTGVGATPRVGRGTVVWYRPEASLDLPEPPDPGDLDAGAERERFERARASAREELEAERERTAERVGESEAEVFDAHRQFLDDPQIAEGVEAAVERGLPAEHAVREAFEGPIEQFAAMEGRMAERADDLRDVRDRLLRGLLGAERTDLGSLPAGTVLFAERLTPSDTAGLDPERVAGVATAAGGRTAHAAIIARSLGLPAVVGVGSALADVADGETVVVDGERGEVVRRPSAETLARADADEGAPVVAERVETRGGTAVEVAANVGSPEEAAAAADRGADGVGLFRTELLFGGREAPPDEEEQYEAYVAACEAFAGDEEGSDGGEGSGDERARVVVRTLDVGGDKPIPYLELDPERNGFLGARGLRLSLDEHADLFETQLRALLRAAATDAGAGLAVMFPMVATVEELEAALDRVRAVADDLEDEGVAHGVPELGAMVETPAAALIAEDLAARVDFLSVGTNDLTQYVLAARRDLEAVSSLHDPLHPAVVRAVARTVEGGHAGGAWVGMCGELAGDPAATELLVGLGLDELSASAVTVPEVKARVAGLDDEAAGETARRALEAETLEGVRSLLDG